MHKNCAMAKRISESDALRIMRDAGFKPLEPYKSGDTAWKVFASSVSVKFLQDLGKSATEAMDANFVAALLSTPKKHCLI